jgi:hypothetical protein
MGVWGEGTFDADYPRDFLADMVGRWELLIQGILGGRLPAEATAMGLTTPGLDSCEACAMPTIEVLIVVAERLEPDYLPLPSTVERWRSQYLELFDRECGSWDARPDFVARRRSVIEETFGRLLDLCSRLGPA